MTKQTRFCMHLLRKGASATLSSVTGTQCPCMISRDADNPEYSHEWHRLYPDADDCNGTGLIDTTTTTTTIKGMVYPVQAATAAGLLSKEIMEVIGETQKDDLLWLGTANGTTGAFVDLSSYTEADDSISYESITYNIRHTFSFPWGSEANVAQAAIFKRNA